MIFDTKLPEPVLNEAIASIDVDYHDEIWLQDRCLANCADGAADYHHPRSAGPVHTQTIIEIVEAVITQLPPGTAPETQQKRVVTPATPGLTD